MLSCSSPGDNRNVPLTILRFMKTKNCYCIRQCKLCQWPGITSKNWPNSMLYTNLVCQQWNSKMPKKEVLYKPQCTIYIFIKYMHMNYCSSCMSFDLKSLGTQTICLFARMSFSKWTKPVKHFVKKKGNYLKRDNTRKHLTTTQHHCFLL